jgi:hypothetical protein
LTSFAFTVTLTRNNRISLKICQLAFLVHFLKLHSAQFQPKIELTGDSVAPNSSIEAARIENRNKLSFTSPETVQTFHLKDVYAVNGGVCLNEPVCCVKLGERSELSLMIWILLLAVLSETKRIRMNFNKM